MKRILMVILMVILIVTLSLCLFSCTDEGDATTTESIDYDFDFERPWGDKEIILPDIEL